MGPRRILIIANKNWEAVALMTVLLDSKACPPRFPWPIRFNHPLPPTSDWHHWHPRGVFRFESLFQGVRRHVEVEVWCIQDAMNPAVSSSSTKEKIRILPKLFDGNSDERAMPDLVVAFGTAGFPGERSHNGCVVVGAHAFIHDPFRDGQSANDHYWHHERTDCLLLPPMLSVDLFNARQTVFGESLYSEVEARFIAPPMNPAADLALLADGDYTAVGVVNITNYDDYKWADEKALRAFESASLSPGENARIGSLETTHGIIRLQSETPFIFVSGITDRIGHFDTDVGSHPYAQNFACAHNAGVVTAWLIPRLVEFLVTRGS